MIPALFIAHGSPMLAIEDNEYSEFLSQLGKQLPRPKAIVVFSAHWLAARQQVGAAVAYQTIHDFGGFPETLYEIQYPAKGNVELAHEIAQLLAENGVSCDLDRQRGLDHGAWVILRRLYPDADIPVVAMSVHPGLQPAAQYGIGKALSALRNQDVLIIGSGGTVHNLRAMRFRDDGRADDWALEFDDWLKQHLQTWDLDSLYRYESLAPAAQLAVPPYGNEHLVPLFYAMGAADDARQATLLHRSYQYGNLSQSVWQFG